MAQRWPGSAGQGILEPEELMEVSGVESRGEGWADGVVG